GRVAGGPTTPRRSPVNRAPTRLWVARTVSGVVCARRSGLPVMGLRTARERSLLSCLFGGWYVGQASGHALLSAWSSWPVAVSGPAGVWKRRPPGGAGYAPREAASGRDAVSLLLRSSRAGHEIRHQVRRRR